MNDSPAGNDPELCPVGDLLRAAPWLERTDAALAATPAALAT
jgi:hypothetical protein